MKTINLAILFSGNGSNLENIYKKMQGLICNSSLGNHCVESTSLRHCEARSAEAIQKNNNIDCHDSATQNLAMTEKIVDFANETQIAETATKTQNLIAESNAKITHPLAPSAREGEQIAESTSLRHCEARSAEAIQKNNNIDCHDLTSSNLAMTEKIVDSANQNKIAESNTKSQNLKMDCHDLPLANLAMTEKISDSANETQIAKSTPKSQNLHAESRIKNAPRGSILDEKSGLRSHERGNRTSGSLTKRVASLPDLSPKDSVLRLNFSIAICSNKSAFGITRCKNLGLKCEVIDYKANKGDFFEKIIATLESHNINLVILAGFMKILPPKFTAKFRAINIHPSILPLFKGAHAIAESYQSDMKIAGVSVHFVNDELDGGALIAQDIIQKIDGESFESFESRIHALEHELYPKAIIKALQTLQTLGF
ncbi:formyltransferase family protein [Helicobacter sp. 23-1045]